MGRAEQRGLYRQQMARRRLGRMIVLTLLILQAGALTLSRNAAYAPDSGDDCAADRHADCRRL